MSNRNRIDPAAPELESLRNRLNGARGPEFWRSLDELSQTDDFEFYLHREFPVQASEWDEQDEVGRRQFLRVMGASLALAGLSGLSGCVTRPAEHIIPYVRQPEEVTPGESLFFSTAAPLGGYGTGLLVESTMGRPIKVEGHPEHPASLGATDLFAQAAILTLYDPDRAQYVTRNGRASTWSDFLADLIRRRREWARTKGAGVRILTETVTSPTLVRQLNAVLGSEELSGARWVQHDPIGQWNSREGARLALGRDVETVVDLSQADVIVALDSDFLTSGPARLAHARQFADRRDPGPEGKVAPNRLYAIEPTPTLTGAMADHRWPLAAGQIPALAVALAQQLGLSGLPSGGAAPDAPWLAALVADLKAAQGKAVVLVGESQPAEVHALGHAINQALGSVGKTVKYHEPVAARAPEGKGQSFAELVEEMRNGKVEALFVVGGNPVYDAPADLDFRAALARVPYRVALTQYVDETAQLCQWHIPEAHYLETWGDIRAFDGTATVQQPLIAALHDGVAPASLISALATGVDRPIRDLVRETWRGDRQDEAFEDYWREVLFAGVVPSTASPAVEAPALQSLASLNVPAAPAAEDGSFEILFRPDPTIHDGRFANNGWLQELPKPLTRTTWENAVLMSAATAQKLGVSYDSREHDVDLVELTYSDRRVTGPIWIMPGQPDGTITVHLGYGRTAAGRVGDNVGFSAYSLRTSKAPWAGTGASLKKTGAQAKIASVQMHQNMAGRDLVRVATFGDYQSHPEHVGAPHGTHELPKGLTIFEHPEPQKRREEGFGNAWGMSIDLSRCIGCGTCVVACQAENNIPVVGKEQVLAGREMHWLRIDRYYQTATESPWSEPAANPKTFFQPVPCMHCENAPCEVVCPVAATSHSAEGINEMTYNRCVGTRYCSNNCPYKVRRFNFLHFNNPTHPLEKMAMNPDVSVRFRGVMEKCTYCVQRVNNARIASEIRKEDRVPGNAVVTACQGACPTRAIVFGNLNDPAADVVVAKKSPRDYALLAELNARPRTTYQTRLTNPNPALEPAASAADSHDGHAHG